jgi:hypothetical protein
VERRDNGRVEVDLMMGTDDEGGVLMGPDTCVVEMDSTVGTKVEDD